MFDWFRKKDHSASSDYFPIKTDMHSHILPGIDDGSPDVETSLELIKGLMALGVKKSIATPHIIGDMYPNNAQTINNALETLRKALVENNIDFEVHAAAEYMLDSYFVELMDKRVPLLTIKDKYVLTEFPFSVLPEYIEEIVFHIFTEGYSPILAHPERYHYVHNNYKVFHRWLDLGFSLQVNLLSLTGYYGKEVLKSAQYLVKNDLVSFVGTDMHHTKHLALLSSPETRKILEVNLSYKEWNRRFN